MADITYEDVLKMAERLTPEEQTMLVVHLLEVAKERDLTKEEREALFKAIMIDIPILNEPSPRREDWYDDDGR